MSSFRVEHDLLGDKQVPADAYYGVQTARAIENFPITGYPLDVELIKALAIVKKCAALANEKESGLDSPIAQAIVKACDRILAGEFHDQFVVDPIQGGAGTSVNMNANEVIANVALEMMGREKGDYKAISPNTHVNMAQSTNDAIPSAIHIALLARIDMLLETMAAMHKGFLAKEKEFAGIIKMGRTHLQDAVPILLGQEFGAYARVVGRDMKRIAQTKENLYDVNMGATAVGTGLNANPRYIKLVAELLARETGMPIRNADDLVDATCNTDSYTEVSGALKTCMINMSKMANDLRILASGPRAGLMEIKLPERQPGSSIMPGKVNPVMCEVVSQTAFQVIGNDVTISMASEGGQLQLNVMEPVMVFNLLQSLSIMNNVFGVFTEYCLKGIVANAQHCKLNVDNSVGVITALNPHLGYEAVSRIAKEAIETGRPVRELCLEHKVLTSEELDIILDPCEMTSPGIAGASLLEKKK